MNPVFLPSIVALVAGVAYFDTAAEVDLLFVIGAALIVALSVTVVARQTADWFSPLGIILVASAIRIGIPAIAMLFVEPIPHVSVVSFPTEYWKRGIGLALLCLLGIIVGWSASPRVLRGLASRITRFLAERSRVDSRAAIVSTFLFILGFIALVFFYSFNYADPVGAILDGRVRTGALRVEGTSRYNVAATLLIFTGSAILASYLLLKRRASATKGLVPAIVASAIFFPFGGRIVALAPLGYGLLMLWYRQRRRPRLLWIASLGMAGLIVLTIYASFILGYRGAGRGIRAGIAATNTTNLREYVDYSIWYEAGGLHSYAAAAWFGPGVIDGTVFPLLGGNISTLFGWDTIRPGAFVVGEMTNYAYSGANQWGVHTGLFVDFFLYHGTLPAVIAVVIFGMILRAAYAGFLSQRQSPSVNVFYALFVWHVFWLHFESVTGALEIFIMGMPLALAVMVTSKVLPKRQPKFRHAPLPQTTSV